MTSFTQNRNVVEGARQAFADVTVADQQSRGATTASIDRLENAAVAVDSADKPNAQSLKRNMRALSFSAPKSSTAEQDPSSSLSVSLGDSDRDDAEFLPPTGKPGARISSSQPRYLRDTQSSMSSRPRRSLRTASSIYQRSDVGSTPSSSLLGTAPNPGVAYGFAGPTATTKAAEMAKASTKAPAKRAAPRTSHLPPKPTGSAPGGSYVTGSTSDSRRVFLDVDFSITSSSTAKATGGKSGSLSARSTWRSLNDHPLYDRSNVSASTTAPARPRTAPARTRKDYEDRDPTYRKKSDPGYSGIAPSIKPISATYHRLHTSFDYGLAGGVGVPSVTSTAPSRAHQQPRRSASTAPGTFTRIKSTGRVSWK